MCAALRKSSKATSLGPELLRTLAAEMRRRYIDCHGFSWPSNVTVLDATSGIEVRLATRLWKLRGEKKSSNAPRQSSGADLTLTMVSVVLGCLVPSNPCARATRKSTAQSSLTSFVVRPRWSSESNRSKHTFSFSSMVPSASADMPHTSSVKARRPTLKASSLTNRRPHRSAGNSGAMRLTTSLNVAWLICVVRQPYLFCSSARIPSISWTVKCVRRASEMSCSSQLSVQLVICCFRLRTSSQRRPKFELSPARSVRICPHISSRYPPLSSSHLQSLSLMLMMASAASMFRSSVPMPALRYCSRRSSSGFPLRWSSPQHFSAASAKATMVARPCGNRPLVSPRGHCECVCNNKQSQNCSSNLCGAHPMKRDRTHLSRTGLRLLANAS
mmetsp:Transcript_20854/g.58517  ORF Transcript_20854/g.58517 Transcript_20854/m.58517 type:complete len:387 (-) Transcript_20854:235-1395(-)